MNELKMKIKKEKKYLQELIEEYNKSINENTRINLYKTIINIENYIKGLEDALGIMSR